MDYFGKFGKVEKNELFVSRGFGYVTFTQPQSVDRYSIGENEQ